MTMEARLREKLIAAFDPIAIEVVNDSHRHHGHQSSPGTGESHFSVRIVSEKFRGASRIERHRLVNEVLASELAGGVHALAIKALAPEES